MKKMRVTILKQDHFGRGITYIDDKICFVEGALPNEICEITISKETKKILEANIVKLIQSSKERTDVICPYYCNEKAQCGDNQKGNSQRGASQCGGCQILHQTYSSQLMFKYQKVCEMMNRYGKINHDKVLPILPSKEQFFYRNKVTLHIQNDKIGYFKEKSNELIEIDHCPLLHPELNRVLLLLKQYIKIHSGLHQAMIRYGNLQQEVLLEVKGKTDKKALTSFFDGKVATLILEDEILFGEGMVTSGLFDKRFQVSHHAFFQVNESQTETLYQIVIDNIKKMKSKNVLDLYCGTGTIGILVSPYVEKVIGVEVVKEAIQNANQNKLLNQISNISFLEGKVEEHLDLLTNEIDTVIVDPPRSGLHVDVISSILKMNAEHIIYVSCDPMTLARDILLLQEQYAVSFIQPVDMFPNTYHVECVSLLSLKSVDK